MENISSDISKVSRKVRQHVFDGNAGGAIGSTVLFRQLGVTNYVNKALDLGKNILSNKDDKVQHLNLVKLEEVKKEQLVRNSNSNSNSIVKDEFNNDLEKNKNPQYKLKNEVENSEFENEVEAEVKIPPLSYDDNENKNKIENENSETHDEYGIFMKQIVSFRRSLDNYINEMKLLICDMFKSQSKLYFKSKKWNKINISRSTSTASSSNISQNDTRVNNNNNIIAVSVEFCESLSLLKEFLYIIEHFLHVEISNRLIKSITNAISKIIIDEMIEDKVLVIIYIYIFYF